MFHREKGIDCKSVSDGVLKGEVGGRSRGGQLGGGGAREGDGGDAAGGGSAPAPGTRISTQ